mgnify:CR=1 FL=1
MRFIVRCRYKEAGELFVSMPRYRSNERDEKNSVILGKSMFLLNLKKKTSMKYREKIS